MAEKVREFKGRPPRGVKVKVANPGKLFKRVMLYVMRKYTLQLFIVVICIFTSVIANVQGTLFMQKLIDDYIVPMLKNGGTDFNPLRNAMLRVACFYAIGVLSAFIHQRIMIYVSQGTLLSLRNDLFGRMESLPLRYFDTHPHGDIMSVYTNDIDTLRQMISQSMPQFLNSIITVVSVLTSMIVLDIPLTVLSLGMIGVMLALTRYLSKFSGKYFHSQQSSIGSLNGYIEEMMTGQKVVKVFCHEDAAIEEFEKRNNKLFENAYNANAFANYMGPANSQLGNLSYVICAIVGGILAINGIGSLTLGKLASFLTFNKSINMPINQLSMQLNSVIMALAGAERIFALLDERAETDDGYVTLVKVETDENGELRETDKKTDIWAWKHPHKADGSITYQKLCGNVDFIGVDFGYNNKKTVLHDIEISAKSGQKIALVGSTGAGKTTITNLINRFYDIQDGKIRFDDININKIKKSDLRRSLGIVLQDTHLFSGTIRDNIRYGRLDANDREVEEAAIRVNADGFIKRLPEGYDTYITGDGAGLSQGQRQLLSIARAAVANPPALILDEATSSIDTRTEKIVQRGMDELMKGRTTFVIAHRLSTVRNSDCILVLEQGRIVERGSHDELIDLMGRYYQLYTGKKANI